MGGLEYSSGGNSSVPAQAQAAAAEPEEWSERRSSVVRPQRRGAQHVQACIGACDRVHRAEALMQCVQAEGCTRGDAVAVQSARAAYGASTGMP
eukprot:3217733-Lingulodinium_polyedra.AAC.1